jgi:hypothetical protein
MAEQFVLVRPAYSDAYLANPHKGCCTFQHFNGDELYPGMTYSECGPEQFPPPVTRRQLPSGQDDLVVKGYLPTTVAYCRWFWELLEPQKGRYDFSVIEKSLEVCKERGQKLAFRAMAFGGMAQPMVPQWYRDKYPMVRYTFPGWEHVDHFMPDPNSPEYLEHWGEFIRELGRRFDGHPLVENYTCAFVGPWGEGDADMSDDQIARFADVFREAFPNTIKIWEFSGHQMRIGLQKGGGWRWNSFGDLGDVGSDYVTKDVSWNHHYDAYPQHLCASGVTEAWKTGPVFFEVGPCPMWWYKQGYDLDFIFQQAFKYHLTYFMPKYAYMPDAWMDKLDAFCRRIGYRYVFRQAKFEAKVKQHGQMAFDCWIENIGVAPIYHRYDFALRFRQDDNSFIAPLADVDVRTWLPGDVCLARALTMPAGLRPGLVELSAGLIDVRTQEAKVSFANKPRYSDRWLHLGKLEVV